MCSTKQEIILSFTCIILLDRAAIMAVETGAAISVAFSPISRTGRYNHWTELHTLLLSITLAVATLGNEVQDPREAEI